MLCFGKFLALCGSLLLATWASGSEPAEQPQTDFFAVRLSSEGRTSYLYGERIFIQVQVQNPTPKGLVYLASGDNVPGFISGVDLWLMCDGKEVPRSGGDVALFPRGSLHHSLVRTLPSGSSLTRRQSLEERNPVLPPGKYTARVTIAQNLQVFGLANGRAESNQIEFTVREWKPKAYVQKSWDRRLGAYTWRESVQLVETTEGQTLVSWRSVEPDIKDKDRMFRIVPIKAKILLESVWWAVSEEDCHVVCDQVDPRRRVLIVADRASSSVSVVELESGGAVHNPGAGALLPWILPPAAVILACGCFWLWRRRCPVAHPSAVARAESGAFHSTLDRFAARR